MAKSRKKAAIKGDPSKLRSKATGDNSTDRAQRKANLQLRMFEVSYSSQPSPEDRPIEVRFAADAMFAELLAHRKGVGPLSHRTCETIRHWLFAAFAEVAEGRTIGVEILSLLEHDVRVFGVHVDMNFLDSARVVTLIGVRADGAIKKTDLQPSNEAVRRVRSEVGRGWYAKFH